MRKFRQHLETATNFAVVIAALSAGIFIFYRWTNPRALAPEAGTKLTELPGIKWKEHEETLVLAIRRGCHFCEDNMPFYRELADLESRHQIKPHLVAVFPDHSKETSDFLRGQRLAIESATDVDLSFIQVIGTPTILLVDSSGRVENVWVGRLDDKEQKRIIERMSICTSCSTH